MNVKPLPGFCFINLEGVYRDTGLIVIPSKYKSYKKSVGRVTAASMTDQNKRDWHGYVIDGKRVIVSCRAQTPIHGTESYRFPIEDILAAIEDDSAAIAVESDEAVRCPHCGPAKSGSANAMMLVNGFCPRCGRNPYGEQKDTTPKVSDEEVARFNQLAEQHTHGWN